jgi:hypothetical protein
MKIANLINHIILSPLREYQHGLPSTAQNYFKIQLQNSPMQIGFKNRGDKKLKGLWVGIMGGAVSRASVCLSLRPGEFRCAVRMIAQKQKKQKFCWGLPCGPCVEVSPVGLVLRSAPPE